MVTTPLSWRTSISTSPTPKLKNRNAIDLRDDYIDLPFRIDQGAVMDDPSAGFIQDKLKVERIMKARSSPQIMELGLDNGHPIRFSYGMERSVHLITLTIYPNQWYLPQLFLIQSPKNHAALEWWVDNIRFAGTRQ